MMSHSNAMRLFDDINEHDTDDLGSWFGTIDDDPLKYVPYNQQMQQHRTTTPSPTGVPSPINNIPVRDAEYILAPLATAEVTPTEPAIYTNFCPTSSSSPTVISSPNNIESTAYIQSSPVVMSTIDTTDMIVTHCSSNRTECDEVDTTAGIIAQQQNDCYIDDGTISMTNQQQHHPSIIQASQLAGCLQLADGRLVVQAQLQQVHTANGGVMMVAVVPSLNRLQLPNDTTTTTTLMNSSAAQQFTIQATPPSPPPPAPSPVKKVVAKTKKPRSIMPRPSRKKTTTKTPAPPPPAAATESNQTSVRLSSEDVQLVQRLSAEIQQLEDEQLQLGCDVHSTAIAQLVQQRARIFEAVLLQQHRTKADSFMVPPSTSHVASIQPRRIQPATSISSQTTAPISICSTLPSLSDDCSYQHNSADCSPGTSDALLQSDDTVRWSSSSTVAAAVGASQRSSSRVSSAISEAQLLRKRTLQKNERIRRVHDSLSALNKSNVVIESPFVNLGDVMHRLLPFHVYSEPDLNETALKIFDDSHQSYSAYLQRRKSCLEHRFRAILLRDSMKSISTKAEEALIAFMQVSDERNRLSNERKLTNDSLELLRAESNICDSNDEHRSVQSIEQSGGRNLPPPHSPPRLPFEINEHIELPDNFEIEYFDCPPTPIAVLSPPKMNEIAEIKDELEIDNDTVSDRVATVVCGQSTSWQHIAPMDDEPIDQHDDYVVERQRVIEDEKCSEHTNNNYQLHRPLRMKIKLESVRKEKRKKNKKKRKWRHSPQSSPDHDHFEQQQQQTKAELKLRFRIAPNGVADVLPSRHHHHHHHISNNNRQPVDSAVIPKVPKLTLKLVGTDSHHRRSAISPSMPTTVGLEASDSESDSVDANNVSTLANGRDHLFSAYGRRHFTAGDGCFNSDAATDGGGADTVHFSSDDDDVSDDDRLRCLTDSLIARLDSVQWPSSCRDNGSISRFEVEHSD